MSPSGHERRFRDSAASHRDRTEYGWVKVLCRISLCLASAFTWVLYPKKLLPCFFVLGAAQVTDIIALMRTLLWNCGVVDHQHGIAAADEPARLNKQFCLHRSRIPDPGSKRPPTEAVPGLLELTLLSL